MRVLREKSSEEKTVLNQHKINTDITCTQSIFYIFNEAANKAAQVLSPFFVCSCRPVVWLVPIYISFFRYVLDSRW